MTNQNPEFVSRALKGWQPQDEKCRAVYELVQAGTPWKKAAEEVGVKRATAQRRYRLRGIESPVRLHGTPDGGINAAAQRTYDKVLNGVFARTAAREEGISYESYRTWLSRNQNQSPSAMLRQAKAGIASFFSEVPNVASPRL